VLLLDSAVGVFERCAMQRNKEVLGSIEGALGQCFKFQIANNYSLIVRVRHEYVNI
jgi:hypothetical protein